MASEVNTDESGLTAGKYLTFNLKDEGYGIGILKVREIIGMMEITPVPKTPEFIKGVINLRGKVIPVVDLRMKFGLEPADYDERTCIIVVEVPTAEGVRAVGIVVDSVSEVANIGDEEIEATPSFGVEVDTAYILGMAKFGNEVKILLDIARVVSGDELDLVSQAA